MELSDFFIPSSLRDQPQWILAILAVGFLSLLKTSISTLHFLYASFLRPGKTLTAYGSWALVTGATDGIGLALARQLARRNLNLLLVGRNPEKLSRVSSDIKEKYGGVRIETLVIDFAGDVEEGVGRLKAKIEGMDVGILVNNAGISYPYAQYLHEVDEGLIGDLIRVNVEAVTRVTRAVLPGMVERRRGAVVNVGSGVAAVLPSEPLYAVYTATKS